MAHSPPPRGGRADDINLKLCRIRKKDKIIIGQNVTQTLSHTHTHMNDPQTPIPRTQMTPIHNFICLYLLNTRTHTRT